MDPISITLVFKGIGMLVAFGVGFLALRYGFRLYKDGAGRGRDQLGIEGWGFKANAHSVGSAVMATAFVWGLIGWSVSPNLERQGENVKIVFHTQPVP